MLSKLDRADFVRALQALGQRVRAKTEIVLGGAGALILTGQLDRTTDDGDVISSTPDLGRLQEDIRSVAKTLDLPAGWLNGSVQSYLDNLPPDYEDRLTSLPPWDKLQVRVVHRKDLLVMKMFAGRPRDIADVVALKPSATELEFVRQQLPRLARIDPARSRHLETVLDQWPST